MSGTDHLIAWKTDDAARERAVLNWEAIVHKKANEIVLGTGVSWEMAVAEARKRLLAY